MQISCGPALIRHAVECFFRQNQLPPLLVHHGLVGSGEIAGDDLGLEKHDLSRLLRSLLLQHRDLLLGLLKLPLDLVALVSLSGNHGGGHQQQAENQEQHGFGHRQA